MAPQKSRNTWLNDAAARRLLVGLIALEQNKRLKDGAIGPDQSVLKLTKSISPRCQDALLIDEESMGFDSLAVLDLILRLNSFFNLNASGIEDYFLVQRSLGSWIELLKLHHKKQGGQLSLSFETSGSSGAPKTATHTLSNLHAELASHLRSPLRELPPITQVVSLVPPIHIYGFIFTALLPSALSIPVVDLSRSAPTKVFDFAGPGSLIIATPFMWEHVKKSERKFGQSVYGLTSSAPSTLETWEAVSKTGLSELIEIYGSTETAGVGWRSVFGSTFSVLPHLSLDSQTDTLFNQLGEKLDIQDNLDWKSKTTFNVIGRKDDIIQIAGVNVSPRIVASTISGIAGVSEVQVRYSDNKLRAFIVLTSELNDTIALKKLVRKEISARLKAPERPSMIEFGSKITRNSMGKVQDWV